ncbi:MAG: hypothetical protein K6G10_13540 [Butyrivibrio sp.]|nr:hypothetical protein [Butyrivibrio sp.]
MNKLTYKIIKKTVNIILVAGVALSVLTGCGHKKDQKLEAYKEAMESFYEKLSYYDSSINSIDPNEEGAKDELLGYLDEMKESYKTMAAAEIPDEFSGIADIAAEASDYMDQANSFYHQAYDGEFDEDSEALASQYYERANNRAFVMLQVLHGEVPSGEGVSVVTEDTYQFSTISASTEE